VIDARRWATAFLTNPILWLWVPAFAGTTVVCVEAVL
jgi:hypothetical protein